MDKRYEIYCLRDRLFYDSPLSVAIEDFTISKAPPPAGWQRITRGEWLVYVPPETRIPGQGWKIHVSTRHEDADEVLTLTRDYCIPRSISFKHLNGPQVHYMRNAKYAPRGASGKLVTIYPEDDAELATVLSELGEILAGRPGPYILSDLRIGEGPLYVRYGGFAERYCEDERGKLVAAFEDGAGDLVPDLREPVFSVPSWVTPPEVLAPHLAARDAVSTVDLPYRVDQALHFSNGGGVYRATDLRTGTEVVLKEGRPYAGLAADGTDAVTRLERERAILERLDGMDGVPRVLDYFTLGEHHFLVQELIPGRPLNTFFAERHPLLDPEPDPERVAGYTEWALKIYAGVERLVEEIHARGVVFGDLHMYNVMIRPDDSVALIDHEIAAPVEEARRQTLANPGFLAPPDRSGFAIDRYSLACLRLALFTPMTTLFVLDRGKAAHLAEVIAGLFPVPRGLLDGAVEEILGGDPATPLPVLGDWEPARESLTRAILASATPGRDDRLFPGDIEQFGGGALGLAHGAAGVLYALDVTGAGRHPEYEDWLVRHATNPARNTGLGLYDGLHGAAFTLAHLGHRDEALKVAEISLGERWDRLGSGLHAGLAGIGLNLDHLAEVTGESGLRDTAMRVAGLVAERLRSSEGPPAEPGLFHGLSGPALMFLRLYERTGDTELLDLAATALHRDLDGCVEDENGAMHVGAGSRMLPYVGRGSVGIGLVLDDYLSHRPDERFHAARGRIRRAAMSPYYAQPGLLTGRAGMLLYLSRHRAAENATEDPGRGHAHPGPRTPDEHTAMHVRNLAWHALPYEDGIAFPGEHMLRLSMDLATGTAGVLLGLGAALHDRPVTLPFLTQEPQPIARPEGGDDK
ncbi:MAG TPA: class III lanthionine synthetase LanKC [Actinomadura sp.]|jgi:tRNA A-37 threonylcarbamoyl transferase component Bud32|nr:class III lanthionine synthetase LanKC [Actinomadura sp.]